MSQETIVSECTSTGVSVTGRRQRSDTKDLIQEVLDSLPLRVALLDAEGVVTRTNTPRDRSDENGHRWPGCGAMVGSNYLGRFRDAAANGDENASLALAGILGVLEGRSADYRALISCLEADGLRWYSMKVAPLADARGVIVIHEDVTDQKTIEFQLARRRAVSEERAEGRGSEVDVFDAESCRQIARYSTANSDFHPAAAVFANSSHGIVIADARRSILTVNDAFTDITGYKREEVVGADLSAFRGVELTVAHESVWRSLNERGRWQGEVSNRRKSGEQYTSWETLDAVRDNNGNIAHFVCLFSDITPLKQVQRDLFHLAHHDSLTGLANRLLFWARLEQSLEHGRRQRERVALLFLDVDDFKAVNDGLGHLAGDRFLKEIAARLKGEVRQEDTIARLGGDEFGIVVEGISDERVVAKFVNKLRAAIEKPLRIAGKRLHPRVSIGIGLFPDHAQTPTALLKVADTAMYRSKQLQRGSASSSRCLTWSAGI